MAGKAVLRGANRYGRIELITANGAKGLPIVIISGMGLIYAANTTLGAATPSQALVAYVGVFVVEAGIL